LDFEHGRVSDDATVERRTSIPLARR
jgi:hypothetical protein